MSSLESVILNNKETKDQIKNLNADLSEKKRENNNLLSEKVSSLRAKMGAMGISPDVGSSAAAISGAKQETEDENNALTRTTSVRIKSLVKNQRKMLKNLLGEASSSTTMLV